MARTSLMDVIPEMEAPNKTTLHPVSNNFAPSSRWSNNKSSSSSCSNNNNSSSSSNNNSSSNRLTEAWTDLEATTIRIQCPILPWLKVPLWMLNWSPNSATTPGRLLFDWVTTINNIWEAPTNAVALHRPGIILTWRLTWDGPEVPARPWRKKRKKKKTEWFPIPFTRKLNATPDVVVAISAPAATTNNINCREVRPSCITSKRRIWVTRIVVKTAATSAVNRLVLTATVVHWSLCNITTTITATIITNWAARANRAVELTIFWRPSVAPSIRRIWGPNTDIRVWISLTLLLNILIRSPSTWASKGLRISTPTATANGHLTRTCTRTSKRPAWLLSVWWTASGSLWLAVPFWNSNAVPPSSRGRPFLSPSVKVKPRTFKEEEENWRKLF